MNKEEVLKDVNDRFDRRVEELGKTMIKLGVNKRLVKNAVNDGYLDPVLEHWNFSDGGLWFYVTLPLDKALFNKTVNNLVLLGWKAGDISLSESSAACTLTGKFYVDQDNSFFLHLSAYGEGVNCRIVVLEPKRYEEGVYEWVCEEGAKEMEDQLEQAKDEGYTDDDNYYVDAETTQ